MRNANVVASFYAPSGVLIECVKASDDLRAEFPHMAEYLYSVRPPNGGIYDMEVGPTMRAAMGKLVKRFPKLGGAS